MVILRTAFSILFVISIGARSIAQPATYFTALQHLTFTNNDVLESNFNFIGTVIAYPLPGADSTGMAYVRIDKVLWSPDAFKNTKGQVVTVFLLKGIKKNVQYYFFTSGLDFGESIGVKEQKSIPFNGLDTMEINSFVKGINDKFHHQQQQLRTDSLITSIKSSPLIILGKVDSIGGKDKNLKIESEHDPKLTKAVIMISEYMYGVQTSKRITVLFAASENGYWSATPKLKVGLEGIFILQKDPLTFIKTNLPMVINPQDYQTRKEYALIKDLIKKNK